MDNNTNIFSNNSYDSGLSFAGKVTFNTSAAADYITSEAYKTLRTNLMFCSADIKSIVITSAVENEGKSTISAELSKSLAEINKRTILIDADMRKSITLRRNLKMQNVLGLSELLSKQANLNQVLYNTQIPYFDVIFSGHFPPNPVELLSSLDFGKLIETLKKHYDFIIIDSPPLNPVIDAAVISTKCDGSVLVISPGKSRFSEAIKAKEQLIKSKSKILGIIVNETNPKHKDASISYKNNYYYTSTTNDKKNLLSKNK